LVLFFRKEHPCLEKPMAPPGKRRHLQRNKFKHEAGLGKPAKSY